MRRKEVVERSYIIPGQMWPSELCWLYDNLAASKSHAEVGVFCGRSLFASVGGMSRNSVVFAVEREVPGAAVQSPHERWVENVLQSTISGIKNVAVHYLPIGSLQAARKFAAEGVVLDSVFIDAGHEYEFVSSDILEWMPLIRSGGLICGHDYSTLFPGVQDAVNELVPGFQVVPDTRIWHKRL